MGGLGISDSNGLASSRIAVKLVHTVDVWRTDEDVFVEMGCGLTGKHFAAAKQFLETTMHFKEAAQPEGDVHKAPGVRSRPLAPESISDYWSFLLKSFQGDLCDRNIKAVSTVTEIIHVI